MILDTGVSMKKIIFCLSLVGAMSFTSAFAQSQADVMQALEQMEKSGMFTKEQIEGAKRELAGWDDEKMMNMVQNARMRAKDPEVRKKAMEIKKQMEKEKGVVFPETGR